MNNNRTALYLRSSKDRSDVSIDAQRRDLANLAEVRGLVIVEEFVDAVESGKTENRPGFQSLYYALKSRERSWDTLLLLDTSRLSRRQYISYFFEHEAEKRGVTLIYKSLPDADPISAMMLKTILQAMDQWHSMISKQKGLAGMAENIKQGFRAGGSAPRGYQLESIETGAVREGKPVTKSRLITNDDAKLVAQILKQRAQGISRRVLHSRFNVPWPENTTLGMEWNALTYAGDTVWNVHAERVDGKTVGGKKRRPRDEWVINKDTHEALITNEEAETLLLNLENSNQSNARRTPAKYLLTGLLESADGQRWCGDAKKYYRLGKGKRVAKAPIDDAVVTQIISDLSSDKFMTALETRTRKELAKLQRKTVSPAMLIRKRMAIESKINKIMDIMTEADDVSPYLNRVKELDAERNQLTIDIEKIERQQQNNQKTSVNKTEIKQLLKKLAKGIAGLEDELLKDFIQGIVGRLVFEDNATPRVVIHYKITTRGAKMASPKIAWTNPSLSAISIVKLGGLAVSG